jgi:hypothetical protein
VRPQHALAQEQGILQHVEEGSLEAFYEGTRMITEASPYGVSDAARVIAAAQRQSRQHQASAVTFSKEAACDELIDVWKACHRENWDRSGAQAVASITLDLARQFLNALPPGYPLPSVGAEPDGHVTLEWYRATERLLSVSVSPQGTLFYAALLGDEDPRGSCRFDREVPATILYWMGRILSP